MKFPLDQQEQEQSKQKECRKKEVIMIKPEIIEVENRKQWK